jgi:hypothetical protein
VGEDTRRSSKERRHATRLRSLATLIGSVVLLNVGLPAVAPSQLKSPPGGTTPAGALFDRLNSATTRPLPQAPATVPTTPSDIWVPDRFVQVPGTDGQVMVPGHWERRLSDHQVYTPPLSGRATNGDIVNFPAGTQPPVNERQAP